MRKRSGCDTPQACSLYIVADRANWVREMLAGIRASARASAIKTLIVTAPLLLVGCYHATVHTAAPARDGISPFIELRIKPDLPPPSLGEPTRMAHLFGASVSRQASGIIIDAMDDSVAHLAPLHRPS